MNDWITYFEKYRSDKLLYEKLRKGEHPRRLPALDERERLLDKLKDSVNEAEELLEHYIDDGINPKEAAMQATEKLYLSYRYIYGMTVMETADALSVSRDTVYRIRRRILARPFPYA